MNKTIIVLCCMLICIISGFVNISTVADDCEFCHEDSDFTDVPVGQIFMWYQSPKNLSFGWYVCNASNHALNASIPDLQSMFLVCYNTTSLYYNDIGGKGGLKNVVLSIAELPKHNHSAPTTILTDLRGLSGNYGNAFGITTVRRTLSVTKDIQLSRNVGVNGGSHENRPLYRTVFYVMYCGV